MELNLRRPLAKPLVFVFLFSSSRRYFSQFGHCFWDTQKPRKFHEVDVDLVSRCYETLFKLDRIRIEADALRAGVGRDNRPRLRRFVDAIV